MPARPWPLWLLTLVLPVGYPVLAELYYPLLLRSGALPSDADSIAIPIRMAHEIAVRVTPVVLLVAFLCLRRYNPATCLWAWRRDRPVRNWIATWLFGGAAFLALGALFSAATWPWPDPVWVPYDALWVVWLLAMRAAYIEQLPR